MASPMRSILAFLGFAVCLTMDIPAPAQADDRLQPVLFDDISGWSDDDHLEAFQTFLNSCHQARHSLPKTRDLGISGIDLQEVCRKALEETGVKTKEQARAFFETHFSPHRIVADGFVTGYFEPTVNGSRTASDLYTVPLLRRPADLVKVRDAEAGRDGIRFGRQTDEGLVPHFDRKAVETGALDDQGLELVWLESRIDAFFIHLQGSARIELTDGSMMRVGFDGKSGHDYTPIGRILIERGELERESVTMDSIRDWLEDHPDKANDLMWQNRSFIFFRENEAEAHLGPVAAANVPLVPWRSLAVDRTLHTFGTPVWVGADLGDVRSAPESVNRLMIAQDTGSAIIGPARGDIFTGSGPDNGQIAGAIKHPAIMFLLVPNPGSKQP
ncbi:murein transglycosylase A [Coralliovum pocilloporae]|uniref:murein transglycosylase A n=1 Tax=Coralliovum pocilloporae TaxID=3066369 RepID=UPI003306AF72